ncbi:MAG: ABC transporter permease [Anaerolineae bacterium]|nr:ABC transporter permease [Anaerolineae bacterium]
MTTTTTAAPSTAPLKRADSFTKPALSPGQLVWLRFRRHKMAMIGMVILGLILLYCTVGAIFMPESYANFNNTKIKLQPPSLEHPFGTDSVGRDLLARTISGGQISLVIGVSAMLVALVVGTLIGAMAGYYGGTIDAVLMRFTEAVFNIPQLFLLIVVGKFFAMEINTIELFGRTFSGSVLVIILIIGLTNWTYLARIVRAQFLSLKERDYVQAARAIGTPNTPIIFRHILPNSIAPIIVAATLGVASAILSEAYVSFLGLGVQAPTASWGNLLVSSYDRLETEPWLWIFPGLLITLTVLAINFVGDGLRDALDPRTQI